MDDEPIRKTPEELLQHLRERSDDIQTVTIPITPVVLETLPNGESRRIPNAGAVIQYFTGKAEVICRSDAESLINDGILQKLNLKIQLKPEGEPLNDPSLLLPPEDNE